MFTHSLRQASFDFALLRSGQALTIPPPHPSPLPRWGEGAFLIPLPFVSGRISEEGMRVGS